MTTVKNFEMIVLEIPGISFQNGRSFIHKDLLPVFTTN